ncbi:MAG: DUF883 family protein [Burkholderiales bacterium]
MTNAPRDKLISDVKVVISDAEDLLKATASAAGEKVAAARERVQDSLHKAKVKLAEAEEVVIQRAKQTARVTDEYVHEHPWRSVGIAAGVGLIVGLLIGRR